MHITTSRLRKYYKNVEKVANLDPKWPPNSLLIRIHSLNRWGQRSEIWYEGTLSLVGNENITKFLHLGSNMADTIIHFPHRLS